MPLACSMCVSMLLTLSLMKNHLERCHKKDENFHIVCQAPGCSKSYDDFEGFKTHLRRKHRDIMHKVLDGVRPLEQSLETEPCMNIGEQACADNDHIGLDSFSMSNEDAAQAIDQPGEQPESSVSGDGRYDALNEDNVRRLNAAYLLGTKESHKLTQKTIDTVVANTTSIVQNSISLLRNNLYNRLDSAGVDFRAVPGLQEFFDELNTRDSITNNPFLGIETKYKQNAAFKKMFGLVEPVRRVVGLTHGHRRNGVDRTAVRKTDEVIEIPFLKSLQQMLSDPSIYYEVEHPHQRVDGLLADFCDGEAFKNHPLFKRYPTALQILLYYDEIEIVNPLGSKTSKHKLGLFYYTLGNIRPEFRSQLKTIQLLAVAARPIVKKYGINTILETFMEELSELEEDEGFHCTINGEEKILRGTIAYSSGDNLGSQEMGGYKIGPGANFKCRECMGSADDIKTKFHERYFTMRTPESYDDQCSQIENSDEDISKQFGICQDSILNQSKYFHVVGSLPGDAMHDVLEGVLQLECKEFLKYVIYESNYLSLDNLNQRILSFDYGYYNDKNKPSGINPRTMNATNNTLKQSASQAWCLARFLPSILGSSIPEEDEKFQLYLLLLEIVEIIFSPLTSCSQASYLQTLIEEHHIKFKELYPSASIIPKMHYMIHYPRTITSLGPMVRSWCMRYESKHTYFKQVAIALGNFINVPYTVAERHQKMQSCQFLDVKEQGSNFLMKPLETGPGFQCVAADEANKENLQRADGNIKEDDLIYKPSWVKVLGTKYKIGAIIHIGNDDYLPLFGVINNIYVLSSSNHRVYFEVDCLHTQEFSPVYRTYIVQKLIHPNVIVIQQKKLQYYLPLHFVKPFGENDNLHISPKFDIYNNK